MQLSALLPAVRAHALTFFAAMDDPRDPSGCTALRDDHGGRVYGVSAAGFCGLDTSWCVTFILILL